MQVFMFHIFLCECNLWASYWSLTSLFFRKIIKQWCSQSRLHFFGETSASHPFFLSLLLLAHWDPPKVIPQQLLTTITYQFYLFFFNPQMVTMWICSTCQMSDHWDSTKSSANWFILNLWISHDCWDHKSPFLVFPINKNDGWTLCFLVKSLFLARRT